MSLTSDEEILTFTRKEIEELLSEIDKLKNSVKSFLNKKQIIDQNDSNFRVILNGKIVPKIGEDLYPCIYLMNDDFIGCYNNFKERKRNTRYVCKEGFIEFEKHKHNNKLNINYVSLLISEENSISLDSEENISLENVIQYILNEDKTVKLSYTSNDLSILYKSNDLSLFNDEFFQLNKMKILGV